MLQKLGGCTVKFMHLRIKTWIQLSLEGCNIWMYHVRNITVLLLVFLPPFRRLDGGDKKNKKWIMRSTFKSLLNHWVLLVYLRLHNNNPVNFYFINFFSGGMYEPGNPELSCKKQSNMGDINPIQQVANHPTFLPVPLRLTMSTFGLKHDCSLDRPNHPLSHLKGEPFSFHTQYGSTSRSFVFLFHKVLLCLIIPVSIFFCRTSF